MVLVLSLLVVVFSLVVPRLMGSVSSRRLVFAADEVRTAWTKTRIMAMRSGKPHQFLYVPQSRVYALVCAPANIEAEDAYQEVINSLSSLSRAVDEQDYRQQAARLISQGRFERLPLAITFLDAATAARLNPRPVAERPSTTNSDQGAGIQAVTFYPDGSASDTTVWLVNEDDEAIPIWLRGVTGVSTVGEPVIGVNGDRP